MTPRAAPPYDVIGVGFGPSNLALAIALAETPAARGLRSRFLERQPHFRWHGGMLLPGSDMQISFLKDLVTLRNPTSPLTFVNYLHSQGRLHDFIDLGTFHPSRIEFNDYLRWVADHFADRCDYGETVVAVEPGLGADGAVETLWVVARDAAGREIRRQTRDLALAVGGAPHLPAAFAALACDPRLCHSSRYLDHVDRCGPGGPLDLSRPGARVAVIGGGQSAAEISHDLHARFPHLQVDLVFRGHALKPSDATPFVNAIFHPDRTDFVYAQPSERRAAIVRSYRNTNYAVIDADLLKALHVIAYREKVSGPQRLQLRPRSEILSACGDADGIRLRTLDRYAETEAERRYDGIVLATGYERDPNPAILEPLAAYRDGSELARDYRVPTRPGFTPRIYVQGYSETSHGLSDTLLSVLPVRAQEIVDSLLDQDRRGGVVAPARPPAAGGIPVWARQGAHP